MPQTSVILDLAIGAVLLLFLFIGARTGFFRMLADLVLVFADHAEILDYKTDRQTDRQYYVDSYAAQLRLYRRAFALRLKVPVTKLTVYSFTLADEIDIPLA